LRQALYSEPSGLPGIFRLASAALVSGFLRLALPILTGRIRPQSFCL
jgi:hypothetical protein